MYTGVKIHSSSPSKTLVQTLRAFSIEPPIPPRPYPHRPASAVRTSVADLSMAPLALVDLSNELSAVKTSLTAARSETTALKSDMNALRVRLAEALKTGEAQKERADKHETELRRRTKEYEDLRRDYLKAIGKLNAAETKADQLNDKLANAPKVHVHMFASSLSSDTSHDPSQSNLHLSQ